MRAEAKKPIKSRKTGAKLYANTVSKQHVARLSSASADRDFKMPKNPGNSTVSGVFLYPEFCLDWSVLMEFERKFMGI